MVGSLVAATGRLRGQDTKWHKYYRKALESTQTNYCLRWSKITLNNILTLINDSYIGLFLGEGGRRCWVLTSSRCYHKPVPVVMTWLLMTVTGVLFHMKVIFSPFARAYLSISLCIQGFVWVRVPNLFGNNLSGNDLPYMQKDSWSLGPIKTWLLVL